MTTHKVKVTRETNRRIALISFQDCRQTVSDTDMQFFLFDSSY